MILIVQCLICFGLGLLPGLDNFSHIGGFATGLLLGVAVLRAPPRIRARLESPASTDYDLDAPYSSLTGAGASVGRKRGLIGYFKGRRVWWWIWNLIRVGCLVLVVVFMAILLNNFYAHGGGNCSWCKYLRYFRGVRWVLMVVVCRLMGGVIWGIFRLRRLVHLDGCCFKLHGIRTLYGIHRI